MWVNEENFNHQNFFVEACNTSYYVTFIDGYDLQISCFNLKKKNGEEYLSWLN